MPRLAEEREGRGGKRGREGDGEVGRGCNTKRGGEDENRGEGTGERSISKKEKGRGRNCEKQKDGESGRKE